MSTIGARNYVSFLQQSREIAHGHTLHAFEKTTKVLPFISRIPPEELDRELVHLDDNQDMTTSRPYEAFRTQEVNCNV